MKMRKLSAFALSVILTATITACSSNKDVTEIKEDAEFNGVITTIVPAADDKSADYGDVADGYTTEEAIDAYDVADEITGGDIEYGGEDVIADSVGDDTAPSGETGISENGEQDYAGLLTASEWKDNENWDYWTDLLKSNSGFINASKTWRIKPINRIAVTVKANGEPEDIYVQNAKVSLLDSAGNKIWTATTDNKGRAYIFSGLFKETQDTSAKINVSYNDFSKDYDLNGKNDISVNINTPVQTVNTLDLMLLVDTTGSMGDELSYLQTEFDDVIKKVKDDYGSVKVNVSVSFYRDEGDDYVVRTFDFTSDIETAGEQLSEQYASGGGDTPEAVHTALSEALKLNWSENSTKLLFLVLDAVPHEENVSEVCEALNSAVEKGVRIIPVVCSGSDESLEYVCRSMAITTGGTYTFLTDDSGIGGAHAEPTVGDHTVEKLNEMIIRIIGEYIG